MDGSDLRIMLTQLFRIPGNLALDYGHRVES